MAIYNKNMENRKDFFHILLDNIKIDGKKYTLYISYKENFPSINNVRIKNIKGETMGIYLIILLLISALLLLSILIFFQLRGIKKCPPNTNIAEKGYWELKYNIQMIVVLSIAATSFFAFFGYSTYKDIKSAVSAEVSTFVKDHTNNLAAVFLVKDIVPKVHENSWEIEFKDLKTIKGDNLPKFEQLPFVSIASYEGALDLHIDELTNQYVKFTFRMSEGPPYKVDLIIFYYL
ncbi:MAG: hypothetical protein U9Q21_01715 [Candidatus Auribacterota bacterium]|nr:hypothetical protein [Candidatus Auribacterota bacterium]